MGVDALSLLRVRQVVRAVSPDPWIPESVVHGPELLCCASNLGCLGWRAIVALVPASQGKARFVLLGRVVSVGHEGHGNVRHSSCDRR